ncbi:TetR/AcrR family transcriptional regulator [Pseudomonas sp. GD04058]|uniref:TetR/AcrR family transcriptional regulator n=1 Tax=Pseudomonas sp. GD04058 TaxID=2975429 RepID=UPI00244B6F6A|nr:helix-turn-helix domain containing protein [Pseudomonas sp. GD04058]MDG9882884.1 TetR/AcrR family transcriptional regulator [Pseudomonas sp. GD04058]
MARRTRADMEQTRATLLAVARQLFSETGYAEASMDDLTARAGLTRGALYHHFGDKQGLLAAVVAQIDAEMDERLKALSDQAPTPWDGFLERCRAYLRMALEPEIQRIVLRDARVVLGAREEERCIASMRELIEQSAIVGVDAEALARMVHGSLTEAAFWIARGEDDAARLEQAGAALDLLLRNLSPE